MSKKKYSTRRLFSTGEPQWLGRTLHSTYKVVQEACVALAQGVLAHLHSWVDIRKYA